MFAIPCDLTTRIMQSWRPRMTGWRGQVIYLPWRRQAATSCVRNVVMEPGKCSACAWKRIASGPGAIACSR